MQIVNIESQEADVRLPRVEVLALRNLLERAAQLPLEAIGPQPIFERLLAEFEVLLERLPAGPG